MLETALPVVTFPAKSFFYFFISETFPSSTATLILFETSAAKLHHTGYRTESHFHERPAACSAPAFSSI